MQKLPLPESPAALRGLIRKGGLVRPTSAMAPGRVQANLVILPRDLAFEFLLFCQRNPKPCPLLEVVDSGAIPEPSSTAPGADLRYDVSKYRVYEHGEVVSEPLDIAGVWKEDMVSFLLGCSFTFEAALMRAGIRLPHVEQDINVSMYITSIDTVPAGIFSGPMVVSMRPVPEDKIVKVIQVTSRFPNVHGAPIHIGDPGAIGVSDISKPDLGDAVEIRKGEVPVFWACGVTPQAVAMQSKPSLMITHSPGHMFITDLYDEDVALF